MMSKMISPAVLSHGLCQCQLYFSQYSTHRPAMGGESKSHDESTEPAEAANTRTTCRAHGMRNEFTTSRLCSAKRLYKQSRSHHQRASDMVEVPLRCRNHGCNEEQSRATSLEISISLRISWAEVIQAVCDLYGLSRERISSIQAEKLSAHSPSLWVITLNERASAIVVYVPGAMEQPVAAPWFEEPD